MGGRTGGHPAVVFVRPILILAAGAVAGAVAWWVLMHEPPRLGPSGAVEHITVDDRLALDHVLGAGRESGHQTER